MPKLGLLCCLPLLSFGKSLGLTWKLCLKPMPIHIGATLRNQKSITPIEMAYSVFGDEHSSSTPIVMLHGFLGSRTNWKTLAKRIAIDLKCQVFISDARNHGDSPHSTISDYSSMMQDLKHFLQKHGIEKSILIGHSMGGRTGMLLSTIHPQLVEKLIVVDISPFGAPENVSPTTDKIFPVLRNLLSQLPLGTSLSKARQTCLKLLPKNIPDIGLVDAILVNLKEDEHGAISWKANVDMDYQSILNPITLSAVFNGPTYFICGERSIYVKPDEFPTIQKYFPEAILHYIEGAGHAVNFDKPVEFQKILYDCLGHQ